MEINVFLFGQLSESIGKSSLKLTGISTTDELKIRLHQQFPGLEKTTYSIAVNKQIIQKNTPLNSGDEVALLPPFSGG